MARPPQNPFAPRKPARSLGRSGYKPPKDPKPRNRANEALICEAVRRKVRLAFRYRTTDTMDRLVDPHVLWVNEEEGATMFCVQRSDESGRADSSPQNFDPYKMSAVRIVDETWVVAADFRRSAYKNVICIVAP